MGKIWNFITGALVTTALVLVTIYFLNRFGVTKALVQTAINPTS